MGKRDLSPSHREFLTGTEVAVAESLSCYCWQTRWWLPVGAERLGACQSVPGNLPDCFAREVRGDGHGNGAPCLGLRAAGAAGASAALALVLAFAVRKGSGEFPCSCRPLPSRLGGSRDSRWDTHILPRICAWSQGTGQIGHGTLSPSWCEPGCCTAQAVIGLAHPELSPRRPGTQGTPPGRAAGDTAAGLPQPLGHPPGRRRRARR